MDRKLLDKNEQPKEENKKFNFQSLTPTSEADQNNVYCSALEEAINEDDHYNIALTGGYGTGKSSIIETFLAKSENYKHDSVLRISLANFNLKSSNKKQEKAGSLIFGKSTTQAEEKISLEISLLQQFVLQIKDKKLKRLFHKQFKEEKNNLSIWCLTIIIILTTISQILFWSPLVLNRLFQFPKFLHIISSYFFKWSIFLIAFGGATYLLFRIIKFINQNKIKSVQVDKLSFDIDSKNEVSLLNSYIEELIHLFKSSAFKLVILEDLDRFENHEIFDKLREVNHILRYSPEVKEKKIKFLYVVRESIFKNENEKNKFFDIIIPVVPFISSKNSRAKMLEFFKGERDSLSKKSSELKSFENIIKLSALCIDEMRTLKSIYNDYTIYLNIIEKNQKDTIEVNKPELLGMMIYKNLFSEDFERINSGTSNLEKVLSKRNYFLKGITNDIEHRVSEKQKAIDEPNNTIENLRREYINAILHSLELGEYIQISGVSSGLKISNLTKDNEFNKIIKHGVDINTQSNHYQHKTLKFSEVESLIDNPKNYQDRVDIISNRTMNENKDIQNSIAKLKAEKEYFRSAPFSEILQKMEVHKIEEVIKTFKEEVDSRENESNKTPQNDIKYNLIVSLLKEGYINLDFKHYTSEFQPGDMSPEDRKVFFDFKAGKKLDYGQEINNPVSFLEEFIPSDWNNLNFLNFNLFDEILTSDNFASQLKRIIKTESEELLFFLNEYIPNLKERKRIKLFKNIFDNWSNFSNRALGLEGFDNSTYDIVLEYFLSEGTMKTVKEQDKESIVGEYLSEKNNVSDIFKEKDFSVNKFKNNVRNSFQELNVKFFNLEESKRTEILDLIYESNLYEINFKMLGVWSKVYEVDYEKLLTYSGLGSVELDNLRSYIDERIVDYVKNILLNLHSKEISWTENEESLELLLNHESISDDLKIELIQNVSYNAFILSDYPLELWNEMLRSQKIKGNWANFVSYHEKFSIDEVFIDYISNKQNLNGLDRYQEVNNNKIKHENIKSFIEALLQEELNKDSLILLKRSYGYYIHPSLISAATKVENIRVLINKKSFNSKRVDEVYEVLKSHFMEEHLHLELALKYQDSILNSAETSIFSEGLDKDELMFVVSNKFRKDYIRNVLTELNAFDEIVFSETEAIEVEKIVRQLNFASREELNFKVFTALEAHKQPSYFVWLYERGKITDNTLYGFLNTFKGKLKDIQKPKKHFTIDYNKDNVEFLDILKKFRLVKNYKPTKKETEIRFRRNHTEVEEW